MTQPVAPGIVFNGPDPNVQFSTVEQNIAGGGANPLARQAVPVAPGMTPDGGIDFAAVQAREAEEQEQGRADEAIRVAEQQRIEEEHGQGETFLTQLGRGALDALLSPASILGMVEETKGRLFGMKALEDFGRDLGKASTGRSALEAAAAGIGAVFGGEQGATSAADQARIAVDEQERAWPLLSTGARIGGGIATGLATGGVSAGAKGLAAIGAIEGAGAGAQAAYDVDAPLTEVWTSALMGGTLGAGLSQVPGAIGAGIGKLRGSQRLAKVFGGEGSMLGDIAEERAFKAIGGRGPEARRLGPQRAKQLGADILDAHLDDGTPIIPRNAMEAARIDQTELTERLAQGMQETGQKLGSLRTRASQFIDESAPELRPSMARLSERLEAEVLPQFDRAAPGARRQASEVRRFMQNMNEQYGDELSLEDFFQERLALDRETNFTSKAPDVMKEVRRVMEDEIEQRLGAAADRSGMANDYLALKRKFGALKQGTEMSSKAAGTEMGNRWLSLSDNMVGMATIAGDLASGGGLSVLKGAAAGMGHKILREQGSILTASLLNRFRRIPVAVDVAQAGGKEAQDAMTSIVRAKKFIQQIADEAGPNANVRAVAENTAQEAATQQLVKLAGGFDRAGWAQASRAPSPLARVLYRTQILDAVSQDLAPTVGRTASMRPSFDFDIDTGKLGRLTKDAEATDAIAAVQAKVREIADSGTGTPGVRPGEVARAARDIPTEEIPHEAYFGREPYHPERVDVDRVSQVGLQGSEYLRDGMRPSSLDAIRKVNDLRSLGPARVSVDPDGNVALIDGRHRMTVAQERGEQTFLAKIIQTNGAGDAVGTVVTEIPIRPQGQLARPAEMVAALEALNTADAGKALAIGHGIARQLMREGKEADARALQLTLGDDLFGQAGRTYRQMTAPPSETLATLADPKQLRESLRTLELRGQLSQQIAEEHRVALAAFEARKRLTGEAVPPEVRSEMRAIEKMWERAEENVTLDGTRLGRIVDVLDNMTENRVASKVPRVPEEQQVQATLQTALKPVEQTLRRSTGRSLVAAALRSVPRAMSQKERIAQYEQRLDTLAQVATQPDTEQQTAAIQEAPAGVRQALVTAQSQKVQNLLRDMPKPRSTIQGTAYDSLSSEEVRRGNAMWEATMEPMSVFEDFARGNVDPDKVAYAWKQYPGIQQMAQLGVLDVLQSQMTAEERSKVPGNVLTQLDYMLGFKGGLQNTVSFEFSQRITGIHEQLQQQSATPSPPSKGLVLPTSKPTMTQRIAGAQ